MYSGFAQGLGTERCRIWGMLMSAPRVQRVLRGSSVKLAPGGCAGPGLDSRVGRKGQLNSRAVYGKGSLNQNLGAEGHSQVSRREGGTARSTRPESSSDETAGASSSILIAKAKMGRPVRSGVKKRRLL